jgi:ribosome-binding protein aMBF1 (putative translation factor)
MPSEDTPKCTRQPGTPSSLRVQAKYISREMSEQFGLVFRDARLRAGLTQMDVAKQARVSQNYVSRLELGWLKLTLESMSLLAGIVGLQVANLVSLDEAEFGSAVGPR